MDPTTKEDLLLVFHCVQLLREVLILVPFPEAAYDAPPAPVEDHSDHASDVDDVQEQTDWIECDDCNKWRKISLELVERGKCGRWVCSDQPDLDCDRACDWCHKADCDCSGSEHAGYTQHGVRIPQGFHFKWKRRTRQNRRIADANWYAICAGCGEHSIDMDRKQKLVKWWSIHADCHEDYYCCPQLSWRQADLDGCPNRLSSGQAHSDPDGDDEDDTADGDQEYALGQQVADAASEDATPAALPAQQPEAAVQAKYPAGPEADHDGAHQSSSAARHAQQASARPAAGQQAYDAAIEQGSPAHEHPEHPQCPQHTAQTTQEAGSEMPAALAGPCDADMIIPDSVESLPDAASVNQQPASSAATNAQPTTPNPREHTVHPEREKGTESPAEGLTEASQARDDLSTSLEINEPTRSHKRKARTPLSCEQQRRRVQPSQASFGEWLLNSANPHTGVKAFWQTSSVETGDETQKAEGSGTASKQASQQQQIESTSELARMRQERDAALKLAARLKADNEDLRREIEQGEPSGSQQEPAAHINRAIAALTSLKDAFCNGAHNLSADIGDQLANHLARAEQLEQLASKSAFGSAEWSAHIQELLQLVASMDVQKQLQPAEADKAAHLQSCIDQLDDAIAEGSKYCDTVQGCLAAVQREQGALVLKADTLRGLRAKKHMHSQLMDIYRRAMQPSC